MNSISPQVHFQNREGMLPGTAVGCITFAESQRKPTLGAFKADTELLKKVESVAKEITTKFNPRNIYLVWTPKAVTVSVIYSGIPGGFKFQERVICLG